MRSAIQYTESYVQQYTRNNQLNSDIYPHSHSNIYKGKPLLTFITFYKFLLLR